MVKSHSKYILIAGIIFISVIIIIVIISSSKKSPTSPTPQPTTSQIQPTLPAVAPSEGVAPNYQLPTPIPPVNFTGAVATQELPTDLKSIGEEKTALRRLTPLYLDFAVIEFDYENDVFLVQLLDPIEESKTQFASWRTQTYPALLDDQFIIN